jgi:hypothetical protein
VRKRRRHHFREHGRRKKDIEAISNPLAQAAEGKSKNAKHHLLYDNKDSEIEIRERFSEHGSGSQKVLS